MSRKLKPREEKALAEAEIKETRGCKQKLPWKQIIQCIIDDVPVKLIAQTFNCTTQAIYYIRKKSGLIKDPLSKIIKKKRKPSPLAFDLSMDKEFNLNEDEDEEEQII